MFSFTPNTPGWLAGWLAGWLHTSTWGSALLCSALFAGTIASRKLRIASAICRFCEHATENTIESAIGI